MNCAYLKKIYGWFLIYPLVLGIGIDGEIIVFLFNWLMRIINLLCHVHWIIMSIYVMDVGVERDMMPSMAEIRWVGTLFMAIACFLWYLYQRKSVEDYLMNIIDRMKKEKLILLHKFTNRVGVFFFFQLVCYTLYYGLYETLIFHIWYQHDYNYRIKEEEIEPNYFLGQNYTGDFYLEFRVFGGVMEVLCHLFVYGLYLFMAFLYIVGVKISTHLRTDYYEDLSKTNFAKIGKFLIF